MATALEQIQGDDYDWTEAFGYASDEGTQAVYQGGTNIQSLDETSTEPFTRADVEHVEKISEGVADEMDWLVVGRLKDGRWFFLSAGCDYTGWD